MPTRRDHDRRTVEPTRAEYDGATRTAAGRRSRAYPAGSSDAAAKAATEVLWPV
ncbi:hypothetical protein [Streptomyces sp. NPDC014676]|uniref:hypothetical protein n=1 Tax=Streptomyces sp. NPDC014676 TaxID=3364879 RepID=UPI0036FAED89